MYTFMTEGVILILHNLSPPVSRDMARSVCGYYCALECVKEEEVRRLLLYTKSVILSSNYYWKYYSNRY